MSVNYSEEIEKARREIQELKSLLEAGESRAKIFTEYNSFGLWEYDIASGTFRRFKKLNGDYSEDGLLSVSNFREQAVESGMIYAEDMPEFTRFCDAMDKGEKDVSCEIRFVVSENVGTAWLRFEGRPVFDSNGAPTKIYGRVVDITREKGGSNTAPDRFDSLTGTYTPKLFRDTVHDKRTGLNRYTNGAFLSVGVDKFLELAAKYGRDHSDYIQRSIAAILTEIGSGSRDSVLARVRDGEFLLYLCFSGDTAPDQVAKLIIDKVNRYSFEKEPVSVSVGISRLRNNKKLEEIYGESFLAMSEAKKSGGACYMRYSSNMSLGLGSGESVSSDASGEEAKIYDLILKAFCSPTEKFSLMRSAFRTLGQYIGASSICFFRLDNSERTHYTVFNASDIPEEDCPRLVQTCDDAALEELFADHDSVRVYEAGGGDDVKGLELANGAACAECRAIRFEGNIVGYFAIVFSGSYELSDRDMQVIKSIKDALTQMYGPYGRAKSREAVKWLHSAIINDHRMEGFSIIPGSFVIDYAGTNASEHYGVRPGDVCYKKMRGRSEPCINCPALKLDESDDMFASSACYVEDEHRWLDITASVATDTKGERRYIISTTDITECLGKVRLMDTLTGAMTFDTFAAEALKLTSEDRTGNFIAVFNIASFRRFNETQGFEAGNMILIAIADILLRCIGEGELVCRNEGSRFIMLLKVSGGDLSAKLEVRLKLLLKSIQEQIYNRFKKQIYLLAGVCNMGDDNVGVMGALDRAITAQHTIREASFLHENQVVFYDGALREAIKERHFIEENMLGALENGEFKVYYQPKVNISTGKIVGAEALVRWIRPDGEIISPGKFVPVFEQNGFITDMDFAIYKTACSDIARWLNNGLEVPLISLNVSRYHLADDNFCEKFNSMVDSLDVPHECLELEITESLLTENLERLIDTVTWFKDRGYRISVDDFGSGYSSLNLITQLPFDTLKIDGGFFLRNDLTDKNKKVISSMVTLAKSLNLETVSEGVETQTQVDFLRDLGCDMIQGFFYYKPMPSADFEDVLTAQRPLVSEGQSVSSRSV